MALLRLSFDHAKVEGPTLTGITMERIYRKGEWIASTVEKLTREPIIREIFFRIIERTVGEDANDLNFPFDRYSAPDGVGRPEKIDTIGQWLCAETRMDAEVLKLPAIHKLIHEGSLDELWNHANVRLLNTGYSSRLPKIEGDEEVILEFEDGHKIVGITRPEAVRNEYCESGISGGVGDGVSNIILRDRDNASVAALIVIGDTIHMRAPGKRRVPFHVTEAYLLDLIIKRDYKLAEPTTIHEAVQISDGRIFDVRDIPDGSRINGGFWLREDGKLISTLPDNLTIDGDFGIFDAVYLRKSPKNLVVNGNAGFVNCTGLATISEGFKASGYTHLETCHNLSLIEDGVEFSQVCFSDELKALDARPFKADKVFVDHHEVGNLSRDRQGLVVVQPDFAKAAVARQTRKEIAQLPGLAATVLVDELKSRIRKGVRSVKKALSENVQDEPPSGPKI
jgi:hypothetical protein